jgi:hypothetical protein
MSLIRQFGRYDWVVLDYTRPQYDFVPFCTGKTTDA